MLGRWIAGGSVVAIFITSPLLEAQLPRLLGPLPEEGLRVAPFFDGWYANPDGTVTFSFGYSNLNKETVEIPLGPNNFIVPKEYDGRQPTSFAPVPPPAEGGRGGGARGAGAGAAAGAAGGAAPAGSPAAAGGTAVAGGAAAAGGTAAAAGGAAGAGGGGGGNRYDRQRGVFTITVPGSFKGDVVWTVRHQGLTWAVPGRTKSTAYQLSWPMAMGSTPPLLRLQPNGPAGRGPAGIQGPPLQAKVGAPLELAIWLTDDAVHDKEPIPVKREEVPGMNVTWHKHSGPTAPVVFSTPREPVKDPQGKATTTATFKEPGEYVVRVQGDTFGHVDSSAADQCCWTNGYWKVAVTR